MKCVMCGSEITNTIRIERGCKTCCADCGNSYERKINTDKHKEYVRGLNK